jgi:DNA repair exonuclease SbcCD ATPase subunit
MPVFGEDQRKKGGAVPIVNEIVGRVNDNTKRLRLLEQREKLLTSRISSMDESVIDKIGTLDNSIKELASKLQEQEERIATIQNTSKEIVNQLQFLARKGEVRKLEEKVKIFESMLSQTETGESGGKGK